MSTNTADTYTALTALDDPEAEDLDGALDDLEARLLDDLEDEDLAAIGLDRDGLFPRPGVRRSGRSARVVA